MKTGTPSYLSFLSTAFLLSLFLYLPAFSTNGGHGSGTGTGTGTGASTGYQQNNNPSSRGTTKDMASIRAYVDKNKDGKISQEEITSSIEEFFDGNSPYELSDLQSLVDSFFD